MTHLMSATSSDSATLYSYPVLLARANSTGLGTAKASGHLAPLPLLAIVSTGGIGTGRASAQMSLFAEPVALQAFGATTARVSRFLKLVNTIAMSATSDSLGSFYLRNSRTCIITGVTFDAYGYPIGKIAVSAYLKTDGQRVTQAYYNNSEIVNEPVTVRSLDDGTWSMNLAAPGDLSPFGLIYLFTIQGIVTSSTSFEYSPVSRDITLVTQGRLPIPTAPIYGVVIDTGGNPVPYAPVKAIVDTTCTEISTKATISASAPVLIAADAGGSYTLNLVPTDNLTPGNRYYIVTENNHYPPKNILVTSLGGFINDSLVPNTTFVGGVGYPLEKIPAEILEKDTKIQPPLSFYDNLDNIRNVIATDFNQEWGAFYRNVPTPIFPDATATGDASINGALFPAGGAQANGIYGSAQVVAVYARAEAGLGAIIKSDTWTTTLGGMISWKSGLSHWAAGAQIEIWLYVGVGGTLSILLSPADEGTALAVPMVQPYSSVKGRNNYTVASINFSVADVADTSYKMFYSIRGS